MTRLINPGLVIQSWGLVAEAFANPHRRILSTLKLKTFGCIHVKVQLKSRCSVEMELDRRQIPSLHHQSLSEPQEQVFSRGQLEETLPLLFPALLTVAVGSSVGGNLKVCAECLPSEERTPLQVQEDRFAPYSGFSCKAENPSISVLLRMQLFIFMWISFPLLCVNPFSNHIRAKLSEVKIWHCSIFFPFYWIFLVVSFVWMGFHKSIMLNYLKAFYSKLGMSHIH